MNKCTTLEEAVTRYGDIDIASGHWPGASQWIQMFRVQPNWFPNWKVLNTQHPVVNIACNIDMHTPLRDSLKAIKDKGLAGLLHTYEGCFNIRLVRGSNHVSTHGYGLAIDINARENALGQPHGGFYDHLDVVKCFTDHGFDWGGAFKSRKDPMHFSYAWE